MTLTAGWWLYDQANTSFEKVAYGVGGIAIAGSPYHTMGKVALRLDDVNYWSQVARVNRSHHAYMARHGMQVSASSARSFAFTRGPFVPAARPGSYPVRILRGRGARLAARIAGRAVPVLGWALLAYDIYTVGKMIAD